MNPNSRLRSSLHGIIEWIVEQLPSLIHRERAGFLNYFIVVLLMSLALALRLAIAPISAGLQYITFFPAVTLSAVIGGIWPGVFAAVIGVSLATYIFTPPYFSLSLAVFHESLWSNMVFLMDSIIVCASIEAMHRYRQRYADELHESRKNEARIAEINKALDEFAYIAAHDLKEPLRGIHNYVSFIREENASQIDEQGRKYLDSIQRLAARLSALIDSLMVYSRLGSSELRREPVDVDSVVDAVATDLGPLWAPRDKGGKGVELRRNGKLGMVNADAARIGEVFQNLFSNACKYNDKEEKWIEVGRLDKEVPVFYVRDNGIGIQHHHHESIFRIFKRLHEQNKFGGGTGAGLTIVKRIVERYGGRIWLESAPGIGSVFYFTIGEHSER